MSAANRGSLIRAVVVIDKEGVIRYLEVLNEITDMPDNEELFEALRRL